MSQKSCKEGYHLTPKGKCYPDFRITNDLKQKIRGNGIWDAVFTYIGNKIASYIRTAYPDLDYAKLKILAKDVVLTSTQLSDLVKNTDRKFVEAYEIYESSLIPAEKEDLQVIDLFDTQVEKNLYKKLMWYLKRDSLKVGDFKPFFDTMNAIIQDADIG